MSNKDGGWRIPDVIDPPKKCITIEIPNDPKHFAAFRGAILELGRWWNWERDDNKSAVKVSSVWYGVILQIYDQLYGPTCEDDIAAAIRAALSFVDTCEDDEMKLRISPDDPCIIQALCEPTGEWEDWYDPRACIAEIAAGTAGQPGAGGSIPAGGCQSWDVVLRGNEKWLLPVGVKGGDTITIENATGGVQVDGGWKCPSGFDFVLNLCLLNTTLCSACPLPTQPKGRLIAKIGSTYYDAYNQTITVPSPVASATPVEFQVNDDNLSDNSGSYQFKLTVCNLSGASTPICYIYGNNGPSPISYGTVFSVTSALNPNGKQVIAMGFDKDVKLTLLSTSGYDLPTGGSETVYATNTGQNSCDINHIFAGTIKLGGNPLFTTLNATSGVYIGSNGGVWSGTFRIDPL